jgi:hypothetical protein
MARIPITQYNVDALIQARKVAMKARVNTLHSPDPSLNERCLRVDIRRKDSTSVDLSLEFYPRIMIRELAGVRTVQRPSASLMWQGKRIRGIDHSLKHDIVKDGVIVGCIRGWHEHYWTDADEDRTIRTPNPTLQNYDLQAVMSWCCKNWNIENFGTQQELYA